MTIAFSCTCGKQLVAKEEFAGKRLRCPTCLKVLVIPGGTVAEAPATGLTETPPAPPPSRPAGVVAGNATRTPLAVDNPWMDRSLDQRATPWRGDDEKRYNQGMKERRGSWLWPATVVLLLAAGAAGAAWFMMPKGLAPARTYNDLELVPRDAAGFLSVRVADLWDRPGMKEVRAHQVELPDLSQTTTGRRLAAAVRERLGIGPEDIERITLVLFNAPEGPPAPKLAMPKKKQPKGGPKKKAGGPKALPKKKGGPPSPSPALGPGLPDLKLWLLVTTNKDYDADAIYDTVARGAHLVWHKGKVYYAFEDSWASSNPVALHFVNPRLFLITWRSAMEDFLDREPDPAAAGPLQTALTLAEQNKHIVVGFNLAAQTKETLAGIAGPGAALPQVKPVLDLQGGNLVLHDGDKRLELDVRLRFADEAKAEQVRDSMKVVMKKWASELAEMDSPPETRAALRRIEDLLHNTTIEARGAEVMLTTSAAKTGRQTKVP